MKTAKELLALGEPLPPGVSSESLPAAMGQDRDDDRGHADWIPKTFLRMTPLDRVGRRALWARFEPLVKDGLISYDGKFLELRAGREGDDARVELKEGDVLTKDSIRQLIDVLITMKFGLESE